ncbi:MAG TPA: phosphoenolpyruvate carboxykinase (ATP) [Dehalococcoidia bacterium]|nr:phosphoenolpyruvate carboxykinase (ATP) [Dehalococcoidia bacterium]
MDRILGKEFRPRKIIDNPSEESLREWALQHGGVITEFGNLSVTTSVRNRMAKLTEVILDRPDPEALDLVYDVLDYLRTKEVIMLDRVMCSTPGYKRHCRLYVTAEYARLPLMWGNTLFPSEGEEPDFIALTVPEWAEKKVFVFPAGGLTIILGSDYKGENKKAMLRQVMYWAKKQGDLGLHAASKVLRVFRGNELKDVGFLLFGLSGTGKTSLSCHSHWLGFPETVIIRQDDVVILRPDGTAVGTEDSFYIKTDGLEPSSQPLLYAAALSPRAILENVFVQPGTGKVDFFDSSLTSNGRAMVKRRDIAFTDDQVDLERVDVIVFITRRLDIMPPVARLNREWAAAAFMLGESVETSAGDPTEAGKSLRVVGTNPFIVGSRTEEGNMFLDILRKKTDIQCFFLNTGVVGGMVRGQKITVKDSVKILEMIAKDNIEWVKDDFWGYEVPLEVPGVDLERFDLKNFYDDDQIEELSEQLKNERVSWLSLFPGLSRDIVNALNP